jgi:hypothetical protein
MSVEDYIKAGLTSELHNGQTRLLARDDVVIHEQLLTHIETLREYRVAIGNLMSSSPADADMLDEAKRNLREHFSVVGLTERFNESVVLIKRRLGWERVRYKPRNVTSERPSRSEMPARTLRLIESQNEKDLELYAFGSRLFDRELEREGMSLELEVAVFGFLNRGYRLVRQGRGFGSQGYRWLRRRFDW